MLQFRCKYGANCFVRVYFLKFLDRKGKTEVQHNSYLYLHIIDINPNRQCHEIFP